MLGVRGAKWEGGPLQGQHTEYKQLEGWPTPCVASIRISEVSTRDAYVAAKQSANGTRERQPQVFKRIHTGNVSLYSPSMEKQGVSGINRGISHRRLFVFFHERQEVCERRVGICERERA